ncbi:hypothetical protein [Desulfosporosinus sp. OT]|uniref:hypothetical protein n=1 Tax=Desulfosporosinus sp. OT TaxID=913865 RepID=UPI000223A799|nr:hypothetical protein [Desulfosporosinus sp. OT]EGW38451.1 hypothetical protein DOT_3735 [Desulfosporosinus sp. OT]
MVPYMSLSQKVKEIYSDFVKLYPTCQYKEAILELTINRILRRLADMTQDTLDNYFIGQQFRVDVTLELTKIALMMHPKLILDSISQEKGKINTSIPILYNQFGKIVYSLD